MKHITIFLLSCLLHLGSIAQQIEYSEVDKDDYREMNFEIIGKMGNNINVYKNFKNRHDISVYDLEMKLKATTELLNRYYTGSIQFEAV